MPDVDPPTSAPARIAPAETPGLTGLLTLAIAVVIIAALYFAREVLIPITLAILLSFVLAPIVELLRKVRVPHVPAVLLAVVLAVGVLLAAAGTIGVQLASIAADIPRYATTIEHKVETMRGATVGRLSQIMARVGKQVEKAVPAQPAPSVPTDQSAGEATPKPIPVTVQQPSSDPITLARSILAPVLGPFETTLIIFIVAVFILMQKEDLRDRVIRLFGSGDLHRTTVALNEAGQRLSRYFLAQLAINAVFGVTIATGLFFIGVPSPILWGVLAAMLRFVPYIGAIIGAVLPLALAAAVQPGWSMVLWTGGLFVVVEGITGQAVEPLIYGHSTGLSPVAVVIAAIFWTWIWGPIGLILSTPLTLCLVVLGRYVDRLEFLDVLLGDRPALTPVENFYQRMLADDPDEAQEQAELLLKERSLSAYYDEVALKGLQLAANDAKRGVLGEAKLEQIKRSIRSLVHDLADHDDSDPRPEEKPAAVEEASKSEKEVAKPEASKAQAPVQSDLAPNWRGEKPVLCIAGRGPLDEAVTTMLAQLLGKHGIDASVLPHAAMSREQIETLDVSGAAMICISYLDLGGSPSHLHYLMRRLRRQTRNIPILVGIWPGDAEVLMDDRLRTVIGADYYTRSLREAVDACVSAAHEKAEAVAA